MQETGAPALAVTRAGIPIGLVSYAQIRPRLNREGAESQTVESIMLNDALAIQQDAALIEAIGALQRSAQTALIVVDTEGRYVGILSDIDLIAPAHQALKPPMIGGLATPLGVYLTTATARAGPGDLALALTGMMMFGLFVISMTAVSAGAELVQANTSFPLKSYMNSPFAGAWNMADMVGAAARGFQIVLFLALLRFLPLAGAHAAEHKVVHAIERGEPLVLEAVRRMPRVHPRCGTNLAAAVFLFLGMTQAFMYLFPGAGSEGHTLMALLFTLFTWRGFGALLQAAATTKPPNDRQIEDAIRVGKELLERHRNLSHVQPTFGLRLWNSGLFQVLIGGLFAGTIVSALQLFLGISLLPQ